MDYLVNQRAFLARSEGMTFELEWAASFEEGRAALARGEHDVCLLDNHLGDREEMASSAR